MSVINKMLRDLDARRAEGALPDLSRQVRTGVMQGAVSVRERRRVVVLRWGTLLLLLLAAAATAWYWQGDVDTPPAAPVMAPVVAPDALRQAAVTPQAEVVAPAAVQPVQAAAVTQAATPATPPSAAAARAVPAQPIAAQTTKPVMAPVASSASAAQLPAASVAKPVPKAAPAAVIAAATPAAASAPVAAASARPATPAAPVPSGVEAGRAVGAPQAAAPVQAPTASAAVAGSTAQEGTAQPPRSRNALQESMAQAQGLWNAGSREAATSLMRDAVATAERVQASDMELQQLVRELARMELAQGHGAAVLELLTRLEPRLAGQADLWAVRGNAAQRLGRHADAVQAYQQALKLRGNEQRWILGTAVSLAALGQMEAAARQTEQARALGPVNPEVLNYLRQAGVPLR